MAEKANPGLTLDIDCYLKPSLQTALGHGFSCGVRWLRLAQLEVERATTLFVPLEAPLAPSIASTLRDSYGKCKAEDHLEGCFRVSRRPNHVSAFRCAGS